ncbi:HTH_Tnp_Tc3_2 domain-containing protein [Trichonephila clavipes]|nr:HTH_Tnp_Tc3_2 domain-containing protein [Trichonephila clavipes]
MSRVRMYSTSGRVCEIYYSDKSHLLDERGIMLTSQGENSALLMNRMPLLRGVPFSICPAHVIEDVNKITEIIEVDRHVSIPSITQELMMDHKTVLSHLSKVGFKKKLDVWVPPQITPENIMDRIFICEALVKWNEIDPFLKRMLEVSEELGIAQSVISRLCQRFQDDGNVSRCYSTGRLRVTTPNEDGYIYLAVTAKRNRRSAASDLSRQHSSATGTAVSRQTVYRRLGPIGLYARRPVRCVPLTATHRRLRLTWSRACIVDTTTVILCDVFRRVQV